MKDLSIIVPVYNGELYINKLIKNLLKLKSVSYEIVIINDGSTDKTNEICEKYARNNRNIKYIYQKNAGVSSARNRGLDNSDSKYILFCDIDDEIDTSSLEIMIRECKSFDAEYYLSGYIEKRYIQNDVRTIETVGSGYYKLSEFLDLFYLNLRENLINYPFNKIFLNSVISDNNIRFDENLTHTEDLIFNLEYLKYVKTVWVSKSNYYIYNKGLNENSLSSKFKIDAWNGRRLSYVKLEEFKEHFNDVDKFKLLNNSYVINSVVYTLKQVAEQKKNWFYIKKQISVVLNQIDINNYLLRDLFLNQKQKIIIWLIRKNFLSVLILMFKINATRKSAYKK